MKFRYDRFAIFGIIACLLLAVVYQAFSISSLRKDVEMLSGRATVGREDRQFASKAIALFAKKAGESPDTVMDGRFISAMHIRDEVCVGLNLDPPGVGATPTYCFRGNGTVSWKDDGGE